jgi:hypothetical protein
MTTKLINSSTKPLKSIISVVRKVKIYLSEIRINSRYARQLRNSEFPVVTIFGSCRQDSIKNHFPVTRIRDGLTYPHYTKEIIQAIRYCMGRIPAEDGIKDTFRNSLLGENLISEKKMYFDFKHTDLFVIEVASRLEYSDGRYYYHHIAFDNRTNINNTKNKSEVEDILQRQSTLEEVESDIAEIIELLNKRVLFVSHISTESNSTRAELTRMLEATCLKLGVNFLNVSELLMNYSIEEICEPEPTISHFTDFGHAVVGDRLREKILFASNWNSKELVQKYEPQPQNEEIHGLGDFLFGCMTTHQEALILGRSPQVDISQHAIHDLMTNDGFCTQEETSHVYHEDGYDQLSKKNVFFTNKRPRFQVTPATRDFVLRKALTPNLEFAKYLSSEFEQLSLINNSYITIHARLGDSELFGAEVIDTILLDRIAHQIAKMANRNLQSSNILFLSDSVNLRQKMSELGFKTFKGVPTHTGDSRISLQSARETLRDFNGLLKAKRIIQISNLPWGSGFSETASILGGIPISKVKLDLFK